MLLFYLFELGLVRQVFLIVSILIRNSFLSCLTFGHLLHMVVVIFHEGRHRKIHTFNCSVLIFILIDLICFSLIKEDFVLLVQLELRVWFRFFLKWLRFVLVD